MRVVVTGALGHVGSRLTQKLLSALPDAEVVMVDNMSSQPCSPLAFFPPGDRLRFIEADVLTANLRDIFEGAWVVIHLAALADATGSFGNEAEVDRVNFSGSHRVAEACMRTGAALVFISTTSVYGTGAGSADEDFPLTELRPQSPYAASKLRTERLLRSLMLSGGLKYIVCRFGTIFGPSPGMKFHTAVNKFCRQAVAGAPITVWKTALNQQRPYLELGDAVDALTQILRLDQFGGQTFNVRTLNTTVARILEEISAFVPGLRMEYVDSPAMNQVSLCVGMGRLSGLGFQSKGTLRQGIGETVRALRAHEVDLKEPAIGLKL